MPRWWPRPRGQLVRSAPEWFNDRLYMGGGAATVNAGLSTTVALENTGDAPTLLLIYGLQIILSAPAMVYFSFQAGAIGTTFFSHIAQSTSQPNPSGTVTSQAPSSLGATGPAMALMAGQWTWPYNYPMATVDPNTSYCLTAFNTGALLTMSVNFWWLEAYQGYNP